MDGRGKAAFFSYPRSTDKHDQGWLSNIRDRLEGEVRQLLGKNDFSVFQDVRDVLTGDPRPWREQIEALIAKSEVFIAIVTPMYVNSDECRSELTSFLKGRPAGKDKIIPILYLETPEVEDESLREALPSGVREIVELLSNRQQVNWKDLRSEPPDAPAVVKAWRALAVTIRKLLPRDTPTPIAPAVLPPSATTNAPAASVRPDSTTTPPAQRTHKQPASMILLAGVIALAWLLANSTASQPELPEQPESTQFKQAPLAVDPSAVQTFFSPSNRWLAAAIPGNKLSLIDLSGQKGPTTLADWAPAATLAIDDGGSTFVSLRQGELEVHDPTGKARPLPLESLTKPLRTIAISPDGTLVAVATSVGEVALVEVGRPRVSVIAHLASVEALAFDQAGGGLAVASARAARVEIYRVRGSSAVLTHTLSGPGPVPFHPQRVAFDREGRDLAVANSGGRVQVWDLGKKSVDEFDSGPGPVRHLSFSTDARMVAALGIAGTLSVRHLENRQTEFFLSTVGTKLLATFHGDRLFTSAAISTRPALLVRVSDRIGPLPGIPCRLDDGAFVTKADEQGNCFFPEIARGDHIVRVGDGHGTSTRSFNIHSALAFALPVLTPSQAWPVVRAKRPVDPR